VHNGSRLRIALYELESRITSLQIEEHMAVFFHYLAPVAVGLVALVLLAGLINMVRGGSGNTSQLLMRWRVILQFVAIIIMMSALYLASR